VLAVFLRKYRRAKVITPQSYHYIVMKNIDQNGKIARRLLENINRIEGTMI
jgi:hypothetical protein